MLTLPQRVEVAKDVLKQVELGFYSVEEQTFLRILAEGDAEVGVARHFWRARHAGMDFQKALRDDPPTKCMVCARGALFLSRVLLYGACKVGESSIQACRGSYEDWGDDAHTIESYFEGTGVRSHDWAILVPRLERLRLICENIIANEGAFVPSQLIAIEEALEC